MTSTQSGAGKSEKTKQKIVTASRDLFAKKGYSETSVRDILEAAEVSKGNLYHHFKGKEFLFLHIMEEDHRFMMETWHEEKQTLHRPLISSQGLQSCLVKWGLTIL